jgi:hypothetical protein
MSNTPIPQLLRERERARALRVVPSVIEKQIATCCRGSRDTTLKQITINQADKVLTQEMCIFNKILIKMKPNCH